MSEIINDKANSKLTGLITWGTLTLFPLFIFSLQFSITLMIQPLKNEFQLNDIWIGVLGASYGIFYTIMQMPIGSIVDKFGTRRITLISLGGCTFFAVLFAFSNGLVWALVTRMGIGFFAASAFTCAFYSAGKWFEFKIFAILVALTESVANLGGVLGTSVLAVTVDDYGWRNTSLLLSILGFVIFIMAVFLVKDKESPAVRKDRNNLRKSSGHSAFHIFAIVIRNKQIWISGMCCGLLFAPLSAFAGLWGVPFLMTKYSIGLEDAGKIVSLMYLGSAAFGPVMAIISNRVRNKIMMIRICTVMAFFIFICLLYLPLKDSYFMYACYFVLGMICSGYILPFAITKSIAREKVSATALALTNVLGGAIGAIVMQPLVGWFLHVIDKLDLGVFENPVVPYYVALFIFPASMILLFYLAGKLKPKDVQQVTTSQGI